MRTALLWVITHQVVEIPYRYFGGNIPVPSSRVKNKGPMDALLRYYVPSSGNSLSTFRGKPLGPIGCPETSVRNYHYSLRNNPEEHSSHLVELSKIFFTAATVWSVY